MFRTAVSQNTKRALAILEKSHLLDDGYLADVAAIKIVAIGDRGKKRDFIDLYAICRKKIPLPKVLKLYDKKYKKLANNFYHITRSLSYFTSAEEDEMPQMIEKISWAEVKTFFTGEVKKLGRELLGIERG